MNKKITLGVLALAIAILAVILMRSANKGGEDAGNTFVDEQKRMSGPCPGTTEIIEMKDSAMPKSMPVGKKFKLLPNWYTCHEVKQGDLVYFRFSSSIDPVVRKVAGVPGKDFKLIQNKKDKNWNIEIDGDLLKDPGKDAHFFGSEHQTLIGLYEKSNKGKLMPRNYLVFSEESPGEKDSGTLGVVNSDDFLGKVEAE
ncbi:MAG: hypothetical protein H7333_11180 [Bdellovibrionales bacterium]|nr:hypothetical protein [Oligoflexia bacterium]